MNSNNIPQELRNLIDSEETDFIIKTGRNTPKKQAYTLLLFSLFWNAFISIFVIAIFGSLLDGEGLDFNSVKMSLKNEDLELVPSLIIGLFLLVGIVMFISGIIQLFQKGAFFAATKSRLIKYRKGKITVTDWEQFSGNIKINSKRQLGDLELELRTGQMKRRSKGSDRFVPHIIYLSEIKNIFDIEKKCRIRIKENDPTPRS